MFTGTSNGEGWKLVSEEQRVGKERGERDERLQEAKKHGYFVGFPSHSWQQKACSSHLKHDLYQ